MSIARTSEPRYAIPGSVLGQEVRESRPFLWLPCDLIDRVTASTQTPHDPKMAGRGQRVMWLAILLALADEVSGQWSRRPNGERSCIVTHGQIGDLLRLGGGKSGAGRHTIMRHTKDMVDAGILIKHESARVRGTLHQQPSSWTIPSADGSVFGWKEKRAHGRVVTVWRSSFTKLSRKVEPKLVPKAMAVYLTMCHLVEMQDGRSPRLHISVADLCDRAGIGADHKTRTAVLRELTRAEDDDGVPMLVTPIKGACEPARAVPRCFEVFDFTS